MITPGEEMPVIPRNRFYVACLDVEKYKLSNQQRPDSWDEGNHEEILGEEHSRQKE